MARYRGPRNKRARREGVDLGLITPGTSGHGALLRRLKIIPGMQVRKRRRRPTDYGLQLREKQKVKRIYGVLEKQFRNYFDKAARVVGHTGEALVVTLEQRLDNVVYRLNLAPTRSAARQYINHGHVLVDGKVVNIPSFLVKPGMVITPKERMLAIPAVKKLLDEKEPKIVPWLLRKGPVGKVTRFPEREDVADDINEQLIIEFYSR